MQGDVNTDCVTLQMFMQTVNITQSLGNKNIFTSGPLYINMYKIMAAGDQFVHSKYNVLLMH